MAERRLADAFTDAFAVLDGRLSAIAGHEAAARDNAARQWQAVAGVHAELDQMRAEVVEHNRGLSRLATEAAQTRENVDAQWGVVTKVEVALGKVADTFERQARLERRRLNALSANQPIFHRFAVSGIVPTTGPLVLNCGGPAVGREWHVKRLVVGGLTLSTTAAGTAEAYVSGFIPDATDTGTAPSTPTSLSDLVDATILAQTALPNIANYDDGQVYLPAREKLWVVIRSGTPGQQYVAAGTVKDLRVMPHEVGESVG